MVPHGNFFVKRNLVRRHKIFRAIVHSSHGHLLTSLGQRALAILAVIGHGSILASLLSQSGAAD